MQNRPIVLKCKDYYLAKSNKGDVTSIDKAELIANHEFSQDELVQLNIWYRAMHKFLLSQWEEQKKEKVKNEIAKPDYKIIRQSTINKLIQEGYTEQEAIDISLMTVNELIEEVTNG